MNLARSWSAGIRSLRKTVGFVSEAVWPQLPAAIFESAANPENLEPRLRKTVWWKRTKKCVRLSKKFGTNIAVEILLLGDVFPVADALRMGLVNQVVPDDRVAATAREIAEKIADGAPLAARWHKKFIYRLLDPRPLTDD